MRDLLRQEIAAMTTTMVVKVGTRVITHPGGRLHEERIAQLAEEIHQVLSTGRRVALVSSGAVGAGMGRLGLSSRPETLAQLQAVAAIGQSHLIEVYERSLRQFGHHAAQILLTAEDIDHRIRYLNARNTILTLFEYGAVPIINENDTVSVEELQTTFGDNDRLAAMVAHLIQAPLLVLLSDVEGLYNGDPRQPGTALVPLIEQFDENVFDFVRDKSGGLSKGGMASKLRAARQTTAAGGNVIIASGRQPGALRKILAGEPVGTLFLAQGPLITARKRWIGFSAQPRGSLILDPGACQAIRNQGRSLLAIGIIDVMGDFDRGDVVALCEPEGRELARGLTNYSSEEVQKIKGLRTSQIAQVLGQCPYDEVVHRNNMVLTC